MIADQAMHCVRMMTDGLIALPVRFVSLLRAMIGREIIVRYL